MILSSFQCDAAAAAAAALSVSVLLTLSAFYTFVPGGPKISDTLFN